MPLIEKVQTCVDDPVLAEADEPDSGPILAAVEILALPAEQLNAATPQRDEVTLWKDTFLSAWDRNRRDRNRVRRIFQARRRNCPTRGYRVNLQSFERACGRVS